MIQIKRKLSVLVLAAIAPLASFGNVSLPSLFSDNMVLRQNSEIRIWGWAKPKEPVRVSTSWSTDTIAVEGKPDASWCVTIATPKGSMQKHRIAIDGYNHIEINNVMIGEVLLCSGQSNMEWSVGAGFIGKDSLVAQANRPEIRTFNVDYRTAQLPCHDVSGRWVEASQWSVGGFSAIGYVVAQRVSDALGVPVGIVNSSWGGTPIEVWTHAEAYATPELKAANDILTDSEWGPCRPGVAYNAMIAPMAGYAISSVLWYQGEENTKNPALYTQMMGELVKGYRNAFGNVPFVYAQIAPYAYGSGKGVEIRERQRRAQTIADCHMVVIGELGDTADIHPRRKIEAGTRFADMVLAKVYGKPSPCQWPDFVSFAAERGKAVVTFSNAEGLRGTTGKHVEGFEVRSADGEFVPARATIDKRGRVVVQAKGVKVPAAVRYGWSDTAMPTLFNGNGLPASSFTSETDF